jgi:hypothetical protein
MCCGLLYAHSHKGIKANGYLDCQWYDHSNIVKDMQDVTSQDEYVMLYESELMVNKLLVW